MNAVPDPARKVDDRVVAVTTDGARLAAACSTGVCVWDTRTGSVEVRGTRTGAFAANADASRFAVGDSRGCVRLLDGAGQVLREYAHGTPASTEGGGVLSVALAPDGRTLASSGDDGMLFLWPTGANTDAERVGLRVVSGHLSYAPDGSRFATVGPREVSVWDAATHRAVASLAVTASGVAFSPTGAQVAITTASGEVSLHDASTLVRTGGVRLGAGAIGPAFSPDATTVAVAVPDRREVVLWTLASGGQRVLTGHTDKPHGVVFAPDGHTLYSASAREGVLAWNLATGDVAKRFALP